MNNRTATFIKWLVTLAMPFFLGLGVVTLIVANGERYVRYEYGKPNFTPDLHRYSAAQQQELGLRPFTPDEREALALVAVNYLQRPEPAEEVIYLLEEQRLPGTGRPFYNEREIGHMLDVKHLTDAIRLLWGLSAALVIGGLLLLVLHAEQRRRAATALLYGGVATTAALLFIALFILLFWDTFFVLFHELLFPPDTWSFNYSDSLIRLFPEMFWFDLGVIVSASALGSGLLVALTGWLWRRALPPAASAAIEAD
jgi:integral membrane protein (TIGR01906 family)